MDAGLHWSTIQEIDLSDGGSFIGDPDLDSKHLPGILEFFVSLVTFESKTRTDWVKDPAVYDAMPEIFISFTEKSLVDSGYRLLGRIIRHAFNSRVSTMDICQAKLIIDNNNGSDIGIQLLSEMPASMRESIYETNSSMKCIIFLLHINTKERTATKKTVGHKALNSPCQLTLVPGVP